MRVSGVLGAGDPLFSRQQRGEPVAGAGDRPLAGPVGEVGAVDQSLGVLVAEGPFTMGSSGTYWSRAPTGLPASPVQ